jgi:hypothetical protein
MQLVEEDFVVREVNHDEMICEMLAEWYKRRPSLRDIYVVVIDHIAILRGHIASQRDRALAIELALDAGADEVQDELQLDWPLAA